ncbi:expressed unknown protein [Seminavis robusta]|uniref:Uncharacterized protein n=1 Tax=Seminavis robusta TaxID=568900 RepID=A0A9N8HQY7_9STRA|nr:expressed unknown protein [Seminavis robusta]|eukprot:Sro1028_g233140.1 n/a (1025) ;mRNA; r:9794-12868
MQSASSSSAKKKKGNPPPASKTSALPIQGYYAVRKGKQGLKDCIFVSWDRAKPFVVGGDDSNTTNNNNSSSNTRSKKRKKKDDEEEVEFSFFAKFEDAIQYIHPGGKSYADLCSNSGDGAKKSPNSSRRKRQAVLGRSLKKMRIPTREAATANEEEEEEEEEEETEDAAMEEAKAEEVEESPPPDDDNKDNNDKNKDKNNKSKDDANNTNNEDATTEEEDNEMQESTNPPAAAASVTTHPLHVLLEQGFQQNLPKGWRSQNLGLFLTRRDQYREPALKQYLQDLVELQNYREANSVPARTNSNNRHFSGASHPLSVYYLNWSWGVCNSYHRDIRRQQKNRPPLTDNNNNTAAATATTTSRAVIVDGVELPHFKAHSSSQTTSNTTATSSSKAKEDATPPEPAAASGLIRELEQAYLSLKERGWRAKAMQESNKNGKPQASDNKEAETKDAAMKEEEPPMPPLKGMAATLEKNNAPAQSSTMETLKGKEVASDKVNPTTITKESDASGGSEPMSTNDDQKDTLEGSTPPAKPDTLEDSTSPAKPESPKQPETVPEQSQPTSKTVAPTENDAKPEGTPKETTPPGSANKDETKAASTEAATEAETTSKEATLDATSKEKAEPVTDSAIIQEGKPVGNEGTTTTTSVQQEEASKSTNNEAMPDSANDKATSVAEKEVVPDADKNPAKPQSAIMPEGQPVGDEGTTPATSDTTAQQAASKEVDATVTAVVATTSESKSDEAKIDVASKEETLPKSNSKSTDIFNVEAEALYQKDLDELLAFRKEHPEELRRCPPIQDHPSGIKSPFTVRYLKWSWGKEFSPDDADEDDHAVAATVAPAGSEPPNKTPKTDAVASAKPPMPSFVDSNRDGTEEMDEDTPALIELLRASWFSNKDKGWRASELGFPQGGNNRKYNSTSRKERERLYLIDLETLKSWWKTYPSSQHYVFTAPDENNNIEQEEGIDRSKFPYGRSGKNNLCKYDRRHKSGINAPWSLTYLNWSWGVSNSYNRDLTRKEKRKAKQDAQQALYI